MRAQTAAVLVLWSLTAALSLPSLSAQAPARSKVSDMAIGRSCRFEKPSYLMRGDLRDNLALFGQRPTLVVFPSSVTWMKTKEKDYRRAFKSVDKYVSKWRRQGYDIVLVIPDVVISRAGSKAGYKLQLAKKLKAKNSIVTELDSVFGHLDEVSTAMSLVKGAGTTKELEFRWLLISELGRVKSAGDSVFGKRLKSELKQLKVSALAKASATKKIFAAINQWRLADAEVMLQKLKDGPAAEKNIESIAKLEAMVDTALQHYRSVYVDHHKLRGYTPEIADALTALAERYLSGTSRGKNLLAEVVSLRGAESYALVEAQRGALRKIQELYKNADAKVDAAYARGFGKRTGYDELLYHQQIAQFYPPVVEAMREFVGSQRQSPYYKEGAMMLMEAMESLADAKQIIADGE